MEEKPDRSPIITSIKLIGSSALSLGFLAPLMIIGAILLGRWFDRLLGTEPWLLVLMIIISLPVTVFMIVRVARDTAEFD